MPMQESLRKPSERLNNMNGNYPRLENNYPGHNITTTTVTNDYYHGNSLRLPLTGPTRTTANRSVINFDNMFSQDATSSILSTTTNHNYNTNLPRLSNVNDNLYTPLWMSRRDDNASMLSDDTLGVSSKCRRFRGGSNRTQREAEKLILSPSQCRMRPPGTTYFENKKKVSVISLKMLASDYRTRDINLRYRALMRPKRPAIYAQTRTRGTQSLYRESSAQTLPYLPPVSNDPDELESMELFKLPTILPGNGPPGLYEVEVLERARKRWAFAKALKENFRQQLHEARTQVRLPQHEHILEAFEWEHWIEREEYIQECQMLRLEILMRMFDKRERQMRNASHARIQQSYNQIEARRRASLQKNEIEFARSMRRLEMEHSKRPRTWRKEHISQGLADPSSEFYAPKMRYGIDPSRRHFSASRKGFDMRMDDLEKRTVKMDPANLKCSFAKLRAWSKPKEVVQEVEQNFCSESNLNKLYESLRNLRETSNRPKMPPLCLKPREIPSTIPEEPDDTEHNTQVSIRDEVVAYEYPMEENSIEDFENQSQLRDDENRDYLTEVRKEKENERKWREHLQREMSKEEFETLLQSYEGHTIGWLMRFLSEEMNRLKEQRKLHFFSMLAKRERYRREAAEAGLRQKENYLRETYENIYQKCEEANLESAQNYMKSIIEEDAKDYAKQEAESHIVALAKDLDKEIGGWLQSFHDIQNPLNYEKLRNALKEIVMPDMEKLLYRLERDDCVGYIVNDVIMPEVYHGLEPYDISFSVATDLIDRLTDNDLYRYSSDCCSKSECSEYCTCSQAQQEASAILRKLIRYSVPGRRWLESNERVAEENVKDILDGVFEKALTQGSIEASNNRMLNMEEKFSFIDLTIPQKDAYYSDNSGGEESPNPESFYKVNRLGLRVPSPPLDITKELMPTEKLLLDDCDRFSMDISDTHIATYEYPRPQANPTIVRSIPSSHDIPSVRAFDNIPIYCHTSSDEIMPYEEEIEEHFEVGYPQVTGDEFDEVRRRIDAWSVENSSTHSGCEEQEIFLEEEDHEEMLIEVEVHSEGENTKNINSEAQDDMDTQVHFDDNKLTIEEIYETEPRPSQGEEEINSKANIPVAFSYDPTVEFTVPIPSNYEMGSETKTGEDDADHKDE
ncbi:uncharacterized protein LOC142227046 [Haematobia irritans]|uniref:uncharacterized protein LOC142227046 n=1 Tax=Haematobia irritans TaxID=7368 RepID=UPI003F501564